MERASFITEVIDCDECYARVRDVLLGEGSSLENGFMFPGGGQVIAGCLKIVEDGDDLFIGEEQIGPDLADVICHELRFVVIGDVDTAWLFTVHPEDDDESIEVMPLVHGDWEAAKDDPEDIVEDDTAKFHEDDGVEDDAGIAEEVAK